MDCDTRKTVTVRPERAPPFADDPLAMIRVYSTRDGRARVISRDDEPPPQPPLMFIAAFPDEAADAAWELLEALQLISRSPGSPWDS